MRIRTLTELAARIIYRKVRLTRMHQLGAANDFSLHSAILFEEKILAELTSQYQLRLHNISRYAGIG